jgi:rfaE bifunctional protein nucleotidyltransferase chain/domain
MCGRTAPSVSRPDALQLEWFAAPVQGTGATVCTGVFDLLHIGHVRFLSSARELGGRLIVGIEDDARVEARKGRSRPLVPERERAEVLGALRAVDGVFVVHGPPDVRDAAAYARLLAPLRPAALALTVGDSAELGKRAAAERLGARVVLLPLVKQRSTSALVQRAVLAL